jgi:bacillithiol system protein YtxJ
MSEFGLIEDTESLDEAFLRSNEHPVVIFKHSNTCPISSGAYGEMVQVSIPVSVVVVQKSRSISEEIVARTGVRHESPQIIVVRNGVPVWTASHWNITAEAVHAAVTKNA